jgi:hypothetical protein
MIKDRTTIKMTLKSDIHNLMFWGETIHSTSLSAGGSIDSNLENSSSGIYFLGKSESKISSW